MQKGIVQILTLGIVFLLLAASGVYIFAKRTTVKEESRNGVIEVNSNSVTELGDADTPTPKATPTLRPVAKTAAKPTNTPQPAAAVDPCEKYKDQNGLTYVKITLIAVGGSTNEPAKITVKPIGDCPAGLPTGYTSEITYTAEPGTSVWKSPGFRPGEIRANIEYKGNGYGYGVEGTIGTHEINVNLKN